MKPKPGRPEMPEGKANNQLINLRISGEIIEEIDEAVKQTKEEKPEWMRNALLNEAKNAPAWVKSKWTSEQLNGKSVEFKLTAPDHYIKGRGDFRVIGNPKGELRIDIVVTVDVSPYKKTDYIYHLYQPTANKIQINSNPKKADFLVLA
jgi:hypothetical protein